jgi:AbrB family looped-hinge helix DNA binding protein
MVRNEAALANWRPDWHTTIAPLHTIWRMTATQHVMKISRNGQVSIPAEARARWNAREVVVVDLGDRVVLRPLLGEPTEMLRGKYRGRGPNLDAARRAARAEEVAGERGRR